MSSSARPRTDVDVTPATLLLIVAVAAGVVAQGGFHQPGRWLIGAPVALAGWSTWRASRSRRTPSVAAVVCALLGGWIAMRGIAAGSAGAAGARVAVLLMVTAAVAVCRRGTHDDRDVLATTVVAAGVGTALVGWIGIAFHHEPWAVTGGATWRAASTLTYPNAAAAVIVIAWSVHIALRRAALPRQPWSASVSAVLAAGAVATQSRAAAVAVVAAVVVLAWTLGVRRVVGAVIAPVAGAVVAVVGLVPGLAADAARSPVAAVAALAAGAITAAALDRVAMWPRRPPRSVTVSALLAAVVVVVVVAAVTASGISLGDRLDPVSADRVGTNRAALDVIATHPLTGVGPGRLVVAFPVNGGLVGTDLVHNEYLQLIAELGLVGGALAAVAALGAGRSLVRRRTRPVSSMRAGCTAALSAFAVHSAFDFLWHIPVVVLLAAVLFGLATSDVPEPDPPHTPTITEEPS